MFTFWTRQHRGIPCMTHSVFVTKEFNKYKNKKTRFPPAHCFAEGSSRLRKVPLQPLPYFLSLYLVGFCWKAAYSSLTHCPETDRHRMVQCSHRPPRHWDQSRQLASSPWSLKHHPRRRHDCHETQLPWWRQNLGATSKPSAWTWQQERFIAFAQGNLYKVWTSLYPASDHNEDISLEASLVKEGREVLVVSGTLWQHRSHQRFCILEQHNGRHWNCILRYCRNHQKTKLSTKVRMGSEVKQMA